MTFEEIAVTAQKSSLPRQEVSSIMSTSVRLFNPQPKDADDSHVSWMIFDNWNVKQSQMLALMSHRAYSSLVEMFIPDHWEYSFGRTHDGKGKADIWLPAEILVEFGCEASTPALALLATLCQIKSDTKYDKFWNPPIT